MSAAIPERETSEKFATGIAIRREVAGGTGIAAAIDSVRIAQALFEEIDGKSDEGDEK